MPEFPSAVVALLQQAAFDGSDLQAVSGVRLASRAERRDVQERCNREKNNFNIHGQGTGLLTNETYQSYVFTLQQMIFVGYGDSLVNRVLGFF
jgi:hypothetical protein